MTLYSKQAPVAGSDFVTASMPLVDLKEHCDKFCVPSSLRECVDQHRVDRVDAAMGEYGLILDDLWALTTQDRLSPNQSFGDLFDPFAHFEGSDATRESPSTFVVLPPVPAKTNITDTARYAAVHMDICRLAEHLSATPTDKVLGLAAAVAAYLLDDRPGFGVNRFAAIRYIALNSIYSENRRYTIRHEIWSKAARGVILPDMVEHRKAHFRELFARVGQPINESEFECMSAVDIAEYASDQRSVLLGHNRHIAFCSKCAGRYLDTMTAILKETNGMVM